MARKEGCDQIYAVAKTFREECLAGSNSLTQQGVSAWTENSLREVWERVIGSPDVSDLGFYDKLSGQLKDASRLAKLVSLDALAFYHLFPNSTYPEKKRDRLIELSGRLGMRDWSPPQDLLSSYEEMGIGNPGIYYNTGLPLMFGYLIALGIEAKSTPNQLRTPNGLVAIADAASTRLKSAAHRDAANMRHIALHLLDPDRFERIASDGQKTKIVARFSSLVKTGQTVDEKLSEIRSALTQQFGLEHFDFYLPEIESLWASPTESVEDTDEPPQKETGKEMLVFIEKTNTINRADRESGPHAFGKALWSPQRSQSGTDIYSVMRDVKPGDVILHIADNQGIMAMSVAESAADDRFRGVDNTAWSNTPSYRISLRDFRKLDPPLLRSDMFDGPTAKELSTLLDNGLRNTFYSRELAFNQGKYLTLAPPELVAVLNRAYKRVAGSDLVSGVSSQPLVTTSPAAPVVSGDLAELTAGFSSYLRSARIRFGARHEALVRSFVTSLLTKRFVILTGLSGSGKTQIALQFGKWLGPDRYCLCAVRPDWTGPESLLGYEDALQPALNGRRAWAVPTVLKFILKAANDEHSPYLLLLDEMNLAHVERYFADVLSGIESDEPCLPNLKEESDGFWRIAQNGPSAIPLPRNLVVIGTVNVDETTYMFSPKVLDRANTLEFRVLTEELFLPNSETYVEEGADPGTLAALVREMQGTGVGNQPAASTSEFLAGHMRTLHAALFEAGFEFGHRTFLEAIRFQSLHARCGEPDAIKSLDMIVLQKVLPRIHGSRREVEPLLESLARYCADPTSFSEDTAVGPAEQHESQLPNSSEKISRMLGRLRANQYVSFTA